MPPKFDELEWGAQELEDRYNLAYDKEDLIRRRRTTGPPRRGGYMLGPVAGKRMTTAISSKSNDPGVLASEVHHTTVDLTVDDTNNTCTKQSEALGSRSY